MYQTIYGDIRLDCSDWAKEVVKKGSEKPFFYVNMGVDNTQGLIITDERGSAISLDTGGLYMMYQSDDCLYVGFSKSSIRYRLSRFKKELIGKSLPDENHPAAKKARKAGYTKDHLYKVKVVSLEEMLTPEFRHLEIMAEHVDEYVAAMINSKFNRKIRK